jgi:hypothetical protein
MSTLLLNTLTGKTSAGSIVVTGEGGSTTTNLQQGVAKCWADYSGAGTTYNDSFNTSSATDNGTGDYTIAIGNDMGSANFSISANCLNSSTQNTDCYVKAMAAGTVQTQIRTGDSGSSTDKQTFVSVHGDLA